MLEPARLFVQPHERSAKLHQLGVDEETIYQATFRGYVARQSCTAFDPPSYPGTVQWAQSHRALRELLTPADWVADDSGNYSRVVSPNGAIAITVATGDGYTGQEGTHEPHTKYPKGAETKVRVNRNVHLEQLSLWEEPKPLSVVATKVEVGAAQQVLWILLVSTTQDEVRYELSRPRGQDDQGRVISWAERIIFPPLEPNEPEQIQHDTDKDDQGDEGLDIVVERI